MTRAVNPDQRREASRVTIPRATGVRPVICATSPTTPGPGFTQQPTPFIEKPILSWRLSEGNKYNPDPKFMHVSALFFRLKMVLHALDLLAKKELTGPYS